MAEQFYTILTAIGKAKMANTNVLGNKINLTALAVGDGNGKYYNPVETQESLVNEVWKGNIQNISIDKDNPNWIVTEGIIPSTIGGFTIREVGLFDEDGDLLVISKYPETYKPIVENGATKDLRIRLILEVSNAANVTLKINPAVIFATKEDIENVDKKVTNNKNEFDTFKQNAVSQISGIEKQIENIDLSADKVKVNNSNLNSKDVNSALTELFTFADNGKKLISNVIGSPLSATDTFQQQKDKIQGLKNTMASNLSSKGQSASGTEGLNSLISKIKNIDTGLKYATGTYHIDTQTNTPKIEVSNLSFKPKLIFVSGRDYRRFPTFFIYSDGELSHSGLEEKWHVRSYYSGSSSEPIMSDNSGIYVYSNSFILYTPRHNHIENVDMFWIAIGE